MTAELFAFCVIAGVCMSIICEYALGWPLLPTIAANTLVCAFAVLLRGDWS